MITLPPTVTVDDVSYRLRRAWPDGRGCAIELTDGEQIRAGRYDGERIVVPAAGHDPGLPALPALLRRGRLVSHRWGKRAVVRTHNGRHYLKVVRPGRVGAIVAGILRGAAFDGPFLTPDIAAVTPSYVTFTTVPGTSLHEAALFEPSDWDRAWSQVLEAWRVTTSRTELRSAGPVHDATAEALVLHRWVRAAAAVLSEDDHERLAAAARRIAGRLETAVPGPVVPAHRDLHDKQLLWSATTGPAVLDLDTACCADAALDLANLRAHAAWRHYQGLWSRSQSEAVFCQVDETAGRRGIEIATLNAYHDASLLRLGCVYAFRPDWERQASAIRAAASAA